MYQTTARRRPWLVRHRFTSALLVIAVALVAWGVVHAVLPAAGVSVPGIVPGHSDYRDPVQLAQAMKQREHGGFASCAKISAGRYVCSVADADGTEGSYQVAVSADGKSYSVS